VSCSPSEHMDQPTHPYYCHLLQALEVLAHSLAHRLGRALSNHGALKSWLDQTCQDDRLHQMFVTQEELRRRIGQEDLVDSSRSQLLPFVARAQLHALVASCCLWSRDRQIWSDAKVNLNSNDAQAVYSRFLQELMQVCPQELKRRHLVFSACLC
jgi:hypothetical protein